MPPRLSIITPSFNRARYIEEAIESVLRQNYSDIEHIIIDGGSTDGTLEILARYRHLKTLSEPDSGMYNALNKGLNIAGGEIVGFLNTDDVYAENIFLPVLKQFENPEIQATAGRAGFFEQTKEKIPNNIFELPPPIPSRLVDESIIGLTIFNAWFFRKSLLVDIGGFDPKYKISGDADIILRLAMKGMRYTILDFVVYAYRKHSDSLTMQLDSQKLLTIWNDHVMFRNTYANRSSTPHLVRHRMNELCTNTCMTISSQYLKEKKYVHSLTWNCRAVCYAPYYFLNVRLKQMRGTSLNAHD